MTRQVGFRRLLSADNALRVRFELERGEVVQFVVQLECVFDENWVAVVRFDTAHGFAHCDRVHPYESAVKTRLKTKDYNLVVVGHFYSTERLNTAVMYWLRLTPSRSA